MEELKTLKDFTLWKIPRIPKRAYCYDGKEPIIKDWYLIDKEELKAEAIKRAKYYTYKANVKGIEDIEIAYWTSRRIEVMDFFNLTQKDLKEKGE